MPPNATTSKDAKEFSRLLADLRRRITALERAPRLKNASIEAQTLPVYDGDQTLRQTIGQQPDGTYTVVDVNGPPPPVPSLPVLEARAGTLVVTSDGTFAGGVPAPLDWDHTEVHVSPVSGYTPTDETQVATFNTLKGGSVTLALDAVPQYVVLVAVNTSRVESAPTAEVAGTPTAPVLTGGIKTYYEDTPPLGLGADDDGSLWFDTNDDNHPYRWDGPTLQWLTVRDGSIAAASAAAATAQTAAANALTAAQAAQATADGAIRTYYQSSPPWANGSSQPPEVVGDLWFDTDDGQAYRWNGTTWVIIEDNSIAAALAAAQNAQTTADGKITSYYQAAIPTVGEIGDLWFDTDDKNKPYYCDSIGPVHWTPIRDGAIADAQATADAALDAATTDGIAPTASPDPTVLAGLGFFIVKWVPITNPDPVKYDIHVSTTLGFTPDTATSSTTRVGTTTGSQFTVRALPGPEPAPGAPDPRTLGYDTTYYVRIIAKDDDGSAPQSLQAPATVFRVTGIDLAVDSVTAANIVTGTLTGELFAASVIMAGTFKTAETGQRIEFGIAGIKGYKSDGSLMISFPTTDGEEALFDGEMIARGLTVLGGASFQSLENEFTADSAVTLMRGIVAPSATPQLSVTYDTLQPSTASLTDAQKTNNDPSWGLGGPFDLVPSEVTCIEWRTTNGGHFVLHQIRPNGTRAWYFDGTGAPKTVGGAYFSDLKNWETWSAFELTTSTTAKNGVYVMFRFMSGAGTDYYLSSPFGLNRYSRQNGVQAPAIGTDGSDVFVAEVINTDDLLIRYFLPDGSGANLTAPFSTVQSTTGYAAAVGMCSVSYSATGFDIGAGRYLSAQRGNGSNVRLLTIFAGGIYPAGTGNNWASPNIDAETFESPTSNRRGICWDGTRFWTYGADGKLYKHTSERWDPAVNSSTYWGKQTFYDSDATGGTHETAPGTAKSYIAKRRAMNLFVPPEIPDNGGTNDPDKVRLYMARGAVAPANSAYHLQFEGSTQTTFTTLNTIAANPPTSSNFPATNPAKLRNDNDELLLSGDGTATFKQIFQGDLGATNEILANPPYYYAYLATSPSPYVAGFLNISTWTADGSPNSSGITYASGNFTVPRAGQYQIVCQMWWSGASGNTGTRTVQAIKVSPSTTLASHTVGSSTVGTVPTPTRINKTCRFAAGEQFFIRASHTTTNPGTANPTGSTPDISYIQVRYVGP